MGFSDQEKADFIEMLKTSGIKNCVAIISEKKKANH